MNSDVARLMGFVGSIGLILIGQKGDVVFANDWVRERWRGDLGSSRHWVEALGYQAPLRLQRAVASCLKSGQPSRLSHYLNPVILPLCHPRDPLTNLPHSVTIQPYAYADGEAGCLIEVCDVSLEADREATLRAKIKEIAKANQMLDLFVAAASHDLRGPLLHISASIDIAREEIDEAGFALPDAADEAFGWISNSLNSLTSLLDNLMLYCRLGAQNTPTTPVPVVPVVTDVLATNPLPKGITLDIDEPVPPLYASEGEITLILRNLICNAVAHHDKPDGHILVSGGEDETSSWATVTDNGPGIPAESRAEVIKPAVRLTNRGSSGLGLAMIHRTLLSRGGALRIQDRPDGAQGVAIQAILPKAEGVGIPPA
ncbi:MAG: sensor histidine kinase [Geminicoccaceae bacterium]